MSFAIVLNFFKGMKYKTHWIHMSQIARTARATPSPSLGTKVASIYQGCQAQKIKKAKFGHKQFQKGQIIKLEKRPNKGQIFKENLPNYI
jgi:hypothetical protein